jgi:Na+/melibiose symporter-like transporter
VFSLVNAIAPPRLGRDFRRLFAAGLLSNLADGLALAAGGLLIASLTRNPNAVAAGALLQRLPWVLFALHAGVVADRFDRRRLIGGANLFRAVLLAGLTVLLAYGQVGVALVLGVLFLLGSAEVVADTTSATLLPMLVDDDDLGVANARLMATQTTVNQLLGPPGGAFLFALGPTVPFAVQAAGLAGAAVLLVRLSVGRPEVSADRTRPSIGGEIADGVRHLWSNRPVRTLALTIVAFNVTFGAAWAVLVLYALERLGLSEIGFGWLIATAAAGGVCSTLLYEQIEARFSLSTVMRVGLAIETFTHLGLALTRSVPVVFAILFLFGAHAAVWGTISTTIRQRTVPQELHGRVGSVYLLGMQGGLVLGAGLGGVLAARFGITAPYWFGFFGSAVLLVLLWRPLDAIARAGTE